MIGSIWCLSSGPEQNLTMAGRKQSVSPRNIPLRAVLGRKVGFGARVLARQKTVELGDVFALCDPGETFGIYRGRARIGPFHGLLSDTPHCTLWLAFA